MVAFYIKWVTPMGRNMTTRYHYDGCTNQQGYTYLGWVRRCIAFGKREGFQYVSYGKEQS
jgi:hypothetical protein